MIIGDAFEIGIKGVTDHEIEKGETSPFPGRTPNLLGSLPD